MKESNILALVRLALSKLGFTSFRNNSGTAWQGEVKRIGAKTIIIDNARPVHFGLATGSSDVIGFKPVVITPEFVNRRVAVFAAIEVKQPGKKPTDEQTNFLDCVKNAGGIAIVAYSADDVEKKLKEWERGKNGGASI